MGQSGPYSPQDGSSIAAIYGHRDHSIRSKASGYLAGWHCHELRGCSRWHGPIFSVIWNQSSKSPLYACAQQHPSSPNRMHTNPCAWPIQACSSLRCYYCVTLLLLVLNPSSSLFQWSGLVKSTRRHADHAERELFIIQLCVFLRINGDVASYDLVHAHSQQVASMMVNVRYTHCKS